MLPPGRLHFAVGATGGFGCKCIGRRPGVSLQAMAVGAQRSNLMTVPTDCDQRDERLGWMGDANLSGDSIALNFDFLQFFKFFLLGIASEVGADGSLTDTVQSFPDRSALLLYEATAAGRRRARAETGGLRLGDARGVCGAGVA